jgi:hypothetical protein
MRSGISAQLHGLPRFSTTSHADSQRLSRICDIPGRFSAFQTDSRRYSVSRASPLPRPRGGLAPWRRWECTPCNGQHSSDAL